MVGSTFVTVIICTRNRADSLGRTLDSLVRASRHVAAEWELVVVDNGSTDHTPAMVANFDGRLPIRRVPQPVAGLSNARNAGVEAASGAYILWTDDDVIVDEQWLAAWFRTFRARPGDAVFGGRTEPLYDEPHQPWFKANQQILAGLLAIRDESDWQEVTSSRIPFGLNYAVRGAEQRSHPYDPNLGVAPGRRRGGEETAVLRAILAEGGTGSWAWDATVFHVIPAERQSLQYIRTYYEALGYDFPIIGLDFDRVSRPRAIWGTIKAIVRSGLSYRKAARTDLAAAVPELIEHAKARGTLKRYIGIKEE